MSLCYTTVARISIAARPFTGDGMIIRALLLHLHLLLCSSERVGQTRRCRRTQHEHTCLRSRVNTRWSVVRLGYQLLMCGAEIVSVNHQTTGYRNLHIVDTGNGKGVRLCCFGEVAWIENAFCKYGIQLDLVFGVSEDDLVLLILDTIVCPHLRSPAAACSSFEQFDEMNK